MSQIVVIGAGPAGLMAAIRAADEGFSVLLLEKMEKPARKLRITGKGRCNITNTKPEAELMKKVYPNSRFFRPAFRNFSNADLVAFLNSSGLDTIVERGDRVFPASQQAWDVANTLVNAAERRGVKICCNTKVSALLSDGHKITGVEVEEESGQRIIRADAVVVATGGLSYPLTGSTGDGYCWAKSLHIELVPTHPSLVALEVKKMPTGLSGLTLRNISMELWVDGGCKEAEFGEMLFNDSGVEGPVVLRLSRQAVAALIKKQRVQLRLDLKPALSAEQLQLRIQRELEEPRPPRTAEELLRKLLPAELITPLAEQAGVSLKASAALSKSERERIVSTLKCYKMDIDGYGDYSHAVVTAGGVSLNELDSKTMRAKKYSNLFFAGEVVDLDADTGGYNLQIAFSTGYLAGLSAARMLSANNS